MATKKSATKRTASRASSKSTPSRASSSKSTPAPASKKSPRSKGTSAIEREASKKPLLLVVRSVTVEPDGIERKKDSVKNIHAPKKSKEKWYGTERRKNKAIIRTRLEYIPVTPDMLGAGKTGDLIEKVMQAQSEKFRKGKGKVNQLSQSAQFVRGSFVNKHTGRMKGNAFVGTTIHAPSVAKIVKKGKGKNAKKVKLSPRTIRTKLANAVTFALNDTDKMLNYGLIKIKEARKEKPKRSHHKKKTNREEKNDSED